MFYFPSLSLRMLWFKLIYPLYTANSFFYLKIFILASLVANFFAQIWRFFCPIKCIFAPRNNSLRASKMKMHWFVLCMTHWHLSPVFCHSWLTSNTLSELSDFGTFSLSLSFVSSPGRHSFILHAADHSSPSLSFLPRPHRPLFLTSACSSPVPLSFLCTAVEWVLVGSPVSAASQIPGLAALHPGCCTHTTHHHSQKGGGQRGAVL